MSFTFASADDCIGIGLRIGQRFIVMDPFTPYECAVTEEEYAAITAYWPKPRPTAPMRVTGIDCETKTVTFG